MSINVNDKNLGHATAYAYYKAGGGTMTEAEFTEFMADFGTASQTAVEAAQTQERYYASMQQVYDLILQDMPVYTICMRTRTQVAGESVSVSGIIRPGEPYRNIESWTNVEP